ncbi:hypothetical protein [Streptomyces virginiae]|uniref:hypothetical protein n=1 Tax=Streptomyces virginiae TaxID=1961 RepID=UPI0036FC05AC
MQDDIDIARRLRTETEPERPQSFSVLVRRGHERAGRKSTEVEPKPYAAIKALAAEAAAANEACCKTRGRTALRSSYSAHWWRVLAPPLKALTVLALRAPGTPAVAEAKVTEDERHAALTSVPAQAESFAAAVVRHHRKCAFTSSLLCVLRKRSYSPRIRRRVEPFGGAQGDLRAAGVQRPGPDTPL